MRGFLRLGRKHPFLVAAFVLAVALSIFLAGRIVLRAVYWAQHAELAVEGWMTPGYVARSWGLEPRALAAAAGLPLPERGAAQTLAQIARDRGVPVAEVIAEAEAAIAILRAAGDTGPGP